MWLMSLSSCRLLIMIINTMIGIVLLFLTVTHGMLLARVDPIMKQVVDLYQKGHETDAFSAMMTVKIQLDMLHNETGFRHTWNPFSTKSCRDMLGDLVGRLQLPNYLEHFEGTEQLMHQIANKCTNADFNGTMLKGFDNSCALCVVILQVSENYINFHRANVTEFINKKLCSFFDGLMKPTCEAFVHYAGPVIIRAITKGQPADKACLTLKMCNNPKCHLRDSFVPEDNSVEKLSVQKHPPWQWIIDLFTKRFGDQHLPVFDYDNDSFSDVGSLRGYDWKGVDCDELNANIYPGRKQSKNQLIDYDCNGIYGKSNSTGQYYEHLLCNNTNRLGIAVVGDSAGAHFSIPEKYFNASMIVKGTYHDILNRIADELDLPMESGYTAHTLTNDYLSHSVYKYLRNWNLCNNNDYQNVGVNGGDSGNSWGNIKALRRNPQTDHPMLVFFELIGNDVCAKSFNSMTTVEQFQKNILRLLNWLDTTLPSGSHLFVYGLADGELLFNYLHDQIHPLNITYSQMYDFLNCLDISPCWGWLNTNATVRKFATERARNLTKVYKKIIDSHTFKNFDIAFYEFPAAEIIERRIEEGGDPKDLIERCDGFHPNGLFHSYLSDWIWDKLQTEHLDWIGPRNPHNDEIIARFGIKPQM